MPQVMVLVLLIRNGYLYLGLKKLKIGFGQLNAPGGKLDPEDGGDLKLAAVRETGQECGAIVYPEDLELVALLHINREGKGHEIDLYVYRTEIFEGEFIETKELGKLEPYAFGEIDYNLMMPADRLWLPDVLFGVSLEATWLYNKERTEVSSFRSHPQKFV